MSELQMVAAQPDDPPVRRADPKTLAMAIANGDELAPDDRRYLVSLVFVPPAAVVPRPKPPPTRDELLRECADKHYEHASIRWQSQRIAEDWAKYFAGPWQRERDASTCPERLDGHPEAFFWKMLRLSGRAIGAEGVRKVLGGG
jgi:hypothetical protein